MSDQPRYEPLEESAFFADGQSSRPLVPGTVPRTLRLARPADNLAVPEHAQLFFSFYFAMTGLHALHVVVGIGVVGVMGSMAWRGRFTPRYHTPVELTGLYWHFVDIVWVFLFPLLYLIH